MGWQGVGFTVTETGATETGEENIPIGICVTVYEPEVVTVMEGEVCGLVDQRFPEA